MRRAAPPTDQFTFYERLISFPLWELSIGLVMLTGIIKAMRYIYPIPGDVLYWVSAIHVGAGVLLGMKFLDHLRYLLAPSRYPLMATMVTGWLPEGYVRRFFPGWYARLAAGPPAPATSPAPARQRPAVRSAGRRRVMKFLWALIGLLYALLNIYVGYLFVVAAMGPKLTRKALRSSRRPSWAAWAWPSWRCR